MNFHTAFDNYEGYVNNLKQTFDDHLIVHVHIPKTAGTSFLSLMRKKYANDEIKTIDWRNIHEAFDEFLLEWDKGKEYNFVTGHFRHYDFSKLEKRNVKYKAITYLRHPIQRLISEYRYMCTDVHPPHEEFKRQHPTFESFALSDMVTPNVLSLILVQYFDSVYDVIDKMKEKYLFVGLSEFYHLYTKTLMDGLNMQYQVTPKLNVTKSTQRNAFDLEYSLYEKLCNIHSIDLQLYDYLLKQSHHLMQSYFEYNLRATK